MNKKRFETHSHSMYSNLKSLDSINKPKDLINRALDLGLGGIAITEHETLASSPEANIYGQSLLEEHPDFKVALGNEIYLIDERSLDKQKYYHFILIAKNKDGFKALRELSSFSWLNSYKTGPMERVPTLEAELDAILKKYPNSLIGTTACLGSRVDTLILEMISYQSLNDFENYQQRVKMIENYIIYNKQRFGDDFYLECAPGCSLDQIRANKYLYQLSQQYNVKLVIGTDAHYLKKEDRLYHKFYLNSRESNDREVDDFYAYSYLQDDEDIRKHFYESGFTDEIIDWMYDNSMEIWSKIENFSLKHSQQIPKVKVKHYEPRENEEVKRYPILSSMFESEDEVERYWANECVEKLKEKELFDDTYLAQLEEEADVKRTIGEKLDTNMFRYPIVLQHYINMMWDCGSIVGVGRGCFTPGNKVLMGDGRQKNIEDVEIGDYVISAFGNKKQVINTLEYPCKEKIYTIVPNTSTSQEIICTDNHEFLVLESAPCPVDRAMCSENCKRRATCKYKANFEKKWKRADELKSTDYLFYPRPIFKEKTIERFDLAEYINESGKSNYEVLEDQIYVKNGKYSFNRFIKLDKDFLYLLGVIIGDGWVATSEGKVGIAFNSSTEKDRASMEKCENYLLSLGFHPSPIKHKTKNLIQLYVYSTPFQSLIESLISHGVENKRIPDVCLYNNKEEMTSLLRGLLASDGSYEKETLRISYDGINYNLISQIKLLAAYLGIFMSITTRAARIDNRGIFNQESYKLRASGKQLNPFLGVLDFPEGVSSSNIQKNLMVKEDGFYFKIKEIRTKEYQGKVHDLTVEDDHCYIVNNVGVHNSACAALNHYLLGIDQLNPVKERFPFFR